MRFFRYFIIVLFLFLTSQLNAEEIDDEAMEYLAYLQINYQIQFYKDYCGKSYDSKISTAEKLFISNNPLFVTTGNNPPALTPAHCLTLPKKKTESFYRN